MTRLYVLSRNIIHFLYPANTIFLQVKTTKGNFWFRKLPLILKMLELFKISQVQWVLAMLMRQWLMLVGGLWWASQSLSWESNY